MPDPAPRQPVYPSEELRERASSPALTVSWFDERVSSAARAARPEGDGPA